jgi:hypothetical protein
LWKSRIAAVIGKADPAIIVTLTKGHSGLTPFRQRYGGVNNIPNQGSLTRKNRDTALVAGVIN